MNARGSRPFGVVSLVQLQPDGLIIDNPGRGTATHFYDADRRVEVARLRISDRGAEATLESGERVLDIHHLDHPGKEYDENDLICVGFSGHYHAMRHEFGDHMADGVAGENIIIDCPGEVWMEDLVDSLMIENQDTGETAPLHVVAVADPCVEFARFCLRQPDGQVPGSRLGEVLRFLGGGRRGFLFLLERSHQSIKVRPGDRVFVQGRDPSSNL